MALLAVLAVLGILLAGFARGAEAQAAPPDTCDDANQGCSNMASWKYAKHPTTGAYDFSVSYLKGAHATFSFTGTSIKWTTAKSPSGGITAVYLDGVKVQTFDAYNSAVLLDRVGYSKTGLTNKPHTIKLVSVGKNRAAADDRTFIDQFNVGTAAYQQNNYRIAYGAAGQDSSGSYSGTWQGFASTKAYGGSYRESTSTTLPATFYFSKGPEIGVKSAVGPRYGEMHVDVYEHNPTTGAERWVGSKILDNEAATLAFVTKSITRVTDGAGVERTLSPNKQYSVQAYSNVGAPVVVDGWSGDLP